MAWWMFGAAPSPEVEHYETPVKVTWASVDLSSMGLCGIYMGTISQEVLRDLYPSEKYESGKSKIIATSPRGPMS